MPLIEYKVVSLDGVLGLVGGLSSIVWGFLSIVFGHYESFKYQSSLIGAVYPVSPPNDDYKGEAGANDDNFEVSRARNAKLSVLRAAA